jgi:autotransporter-associated beta strand protein/T5SS/PEP-CTERM-associated repeat protein
MKLSLLSSVFALCAALLVAGSPAGAATYSYTNGQDNTASITVTEPSTFTIASGSALQSGPVIDGGTTFSMTKTGGGTLTISSPVNFMSTLNVRGGSMRFTGTGSLLEYLNVDNQLGQTAPVFEVAGGSVWIYTTYIGTYTAAEVRVTNGGLYVARNNADFGRNSGTGTLVVTGSGSEFRLTGGHDLALGRTGYGSVTVNNGARINSTYGNRRILFAEGPQGRGMLNVGSASGAAAVAPGTVSVNRIATGGGTGTIFFNHTSTNYYFTQDAQAFGPNILVESRTAVQVENGTTTMSGTNTYTGGTTVVGGTLLISNSGTASVLGTGAVKVGVDGTLGGVGRVLGATTISGTLTPGNSPGLMTFQNGLTLDSDATVVMEIGGMGRGTTYDAIDVNGLLVLAGELQVVFIGGYVPEVGDSFQFFGGNAVATGNFSSVNVVNGYQGTYNPGTGRFVVTSLVPEPSALLLSIGAAVLLGFARRSRVAR